MSINNRFAEIDFIKGIAIIWIVVFHVFRDSKAVFVGESGGTGLSLSHLALWGALGVDLFVICSGFLLSYSYKNTEPAGKFLIRRVKRLLPLYYTAIFFFLLLDFLIGRDNFQLNIMSVILHMLCLHSFTGYIFDIEGAWWFMGLIVQLCVLFPLICRLSKSFNKIYVFLACILLTVVARFIGIANINTNYSVFAFLPAFVFGMLVHEYTDSEKRTNQDFQSFGNFGSLNFIISYITKNLKFIGAGYCTISMGLLIYVMIQDISVFSFLYGLARPIVTIGIFLLLSALCRASIRFCRPVLLFISLFGVNSYAIYLFHRPFIFKYVTVTSPIINNIIIIMLFLLIMLGVGFALTNLEKRLQTFI